MQLDHLLLDVQISQFFQCKEKCPNSTQGSLTKIYMHRTSLEVKPGPKRGKGQMQSWPRQRPHIHTEYPELYLTPGDNFLPMQSSI